MFRKLGNWIRVGVAMLSKSGRALNIKLDDRQERYCIKIDDLRKVTHYGTRKVAYIYLIPEEEFEPVKRLRDYR